jgi:hypothetical protein
MNRIKTFNESQDSIVWVVLTTYWDGDVSDVKTFLKEMDAVDHYINIVNKIFKTEFEPMKEEGERLFIKPDDNPDYVKSIEYVNKQRGRGTSDAANNNQYWPWIYKTTLN